MTTTAAKTTRKAHTLKGGDRIVDARMFRVLEVFDTFPLNGRETAVRVILPSGRVQSLSFLNDADVKVEW